MFPSLGCCRILAVVVVVTGRHDGIKAQPFRIQRSYTQPREIVNQASRTSVKHWTADYPDFVSPWVQSLPPRKRQLP